LNAQIHDMREQQKLLIGALQAQPQQNMQALQVEQQPLLEIMNQNIEKLLELNTQQDQAISMSKMSWKIADNVLQDCKLVLVNQTLDKEYRRKFETFKWINDIENDQNSVEAANHLSSQLAKYQLIGKDTYEVIDIHKKKDLFKAHVGKFILKGSGDAVILPFSVDEDSAAICCRVIIEWKTPKTIKYADVKAQAMGELIAANALSIHPVVCIVTDLNTTFHIFAIKDKTVQIYKDLNVEQGFYYLVDYLQNVASPNIDFNVYEENNGISSSSEKILNFINGAFTIKNNITKSLFQEQYESIVDSSMSLKEKLTLALELHEPSWRSYFG